MRCAVTFCLALLALAPMSAGSAVAQGQQFGASYPPVNGWNNSTTSQGSPTPASNHYPYGNPNQAAVGNTLQTPVAGYASNQTAGQQQHNYQYPSTLLAPFAPKVNPQPVGYTTGNYNNGGYPTWQDQAGNAVPGQAGGDANNGAILPQPEPINGGAGIGQPLDAGQQHMQTYPNQGSIVQPMNMGGQQYHQHAPSYQAPAQNYHVPQQTYSAPVHNHSYAPVHNHGHQPGCNGGCGGSCQAGVAGGQTLGMGYQPGVYGDGSPYFESVNGGWGGSGFVAGGVAAAPVRRRGGWFGGVNGLIMARDYESNEYFSFYPGDPRNSILNSRSAELGTMGGYEFSIGRCMQNGWAWMGTYWGIAQDHVSVTRTGQPDTHLLGLQYVDYTPAGFALNNMYAWFNGAESHRIRRQNEFHNLEINFFRGGTLTTTTFGPGVGGGFAGAGAGAGGFGLGGGCGAGGCGAGGCGTGACGTGGCGCGGCGTAWNVSWSAGARFFKFDEFFQFAASTTGGYTYAPREFFYDIEAENNLVGFQFGGNASRAFGRCFSVFGGTKFGLYNNRINHYSRIYGPSGDAIINQGSYAGTAFSVRSRKDDLAMMGEINLGLRYQFSRCWRATIGYRALAVTGVALAPDQIPNDFTSIPEIRYIDSDGSLILHGAYAGLEFRR